MKTKLFVLLLLLAPQLAKAATSIEWWQFWTDPKIKPVLQAVVRNFEKENPDIKVIMTDLTWANGHEKIVIAFASGRAPDVVELGSDWIAQFADRGQLADLTDWIVPDSGDVMGWGMSTYKDRVYARPWFLGTRVLFINRDLLDRAGLDASFVPISWADLEKAAKDVHALSSDIYGWGSNTAEKHRLYKKFLPFFYSSGAQFLTDDGQLSVISSIHAIEALTQYKRLHDSCGYVGSQRQLEDAFLDGKIGFIFSGDWLLKRIEAEKREINFETSMIPGPKFPGQSFLGGEFLAVSESSEHKDAAKKFINFITSPKNQALFCKANFSATPASLTAQKDPYFQSTDHFILFNRQLLSAKHPPVNPHWVEFEAILEEAIEDALFGSKLIAEPLRKAQKDIEQIMGK